MPIVPRYDWRGSQVVIAHPRDHHGDLLFRYLQHLGCIVEISWPPAVPLTQAIDFLFCAVDEKARRLLEVYSSRTTTAVIGVSDPNNAGTLRLLQDLTPHAVLNKPFEPPAILINLVAARANLRYQRRLLSKVAKLEETLRSFRRVELAKNILMETRKINEPAAYAYLREQAMRRRVSIGAVASVVIDSDAVLSPEIG